MTENTEKPDKDEVTDEQLEEIAGGTTGTTDTKVVKKKTLTKPVDGEATDKDHNEWIDV